MITLEYIESLYEKYLVELQEVRNIQRSIYSTKFLPALDDIESEITYMLIRESGVKFVVEISPNYGWSSSWILKALEPVEGILYSYDMHSGCLGNITEKNRFLFIEGDATKNLDKMPGIIPYLFLDSDHNKEFADWYIENLFPRVPSGGIVSVHDIINSVNSSWGEIPIILNYLNENQIPYFSPHNNSKELISLKRKLGIEKVIHHINDPIIFFEL